MARKLALIGLVALALTGCGGGGTPTTGVGPSAKTKTNVSNGHKHILTSLAGAGFQRGPQASLANGVASSPKGSMPMFGAFIRNSIVAPVLGIKGRKSAIAIAPVDGTVSSPPDSGGGDIDTPGIYYSDYLGLWVENVIVSPTEARMNLWLDQAKTTSAGSFDSTFPADFTAIPQTYHSTFSITAGPFAGSSGTDDFVIDSFTTGHTNYQANWVGQGSFVGTASWSPSGYTWSNSATSADGSWFKDAGTFNADGSGDTTSQNSAGYKYTYHYAADGSGSGRIEGPDAGLPATIVWDNQGNVTITYADGSTEHWNMWNVIAVPVTGTGAGSGSSGGGVPVNPPPIATNAAKAK